MPNYRLLTQVDAGDPLGSELGARKPRADEIAKRQAEGAAKEAAEQKAYNFERTVHATEKQMRDELLKPPESGRASGSAPLGNSGYTTSTQSKLDRVVNLLVQAAAADKMATNFRERHKAKLIEAGWIPAGSAKVTGIWNNTREPAIVDESADVSLDLNYSGTSTGRLTSSQPKPRDRNWVTPNTYLDEQGFLHKVGSPLAALPDPER